MTCQMMCTTSTFAVLTHTEEREAMQSAGIAAQRRRALSRSRRNSQSSQSSVLRQDSLEDVSLTNLVDALSNTEGELLITLHEHVSMSGMCSVTLVLLYMNDGLVLLYIVMGDVMQGISQGKSQGKPKECAA